MKKTKLLEDIGLNETTAKIYLYLLKNKKATILEVARGTGIARTNIYHNIKMLIDNNLIVEAVEKGKKLLVPEKPNNLVKMIKKKEIIAKEIAEILLPDFEKNKYESKIRFAYGSEGFKMSADELLNSKEKIIRQFIDFESSNRYASNKYLEKHWLKRVSKKIEAKIICSEQSINFSNKNLTDIENIKKLREVRFIPKLHFNFSIAVVDDKVHFFAPPNEGFIFIFESKSFSNTIKNIFEFLWNQSYRIDKTTPAL